MKTSNKFICSLAASLAVGGLAHAFSLGGPPAAWMTADMGYDAVVGPMTPGEGYRFNAPVVVYGFDQSFIEFFGAEGVAAVESAMKILNDLPAASSINPGLFPTSTTRINHSARRLRLLDVKSNVLAMLLEQMGLTSPERFMWSLRQVNRPNEFVRNFLTIRRNYDPFTVLPSSFINGTLYTFQIVPIGDDLWEAEEISIDPAEPNISVVGYAGGGLVDERVARLHDARGLFFSGLTQDDVGGLRYLYHPGTVAVELLPAGTTLRTTRAVDEVSSGGGGSQGGWTPFYGVGIVTDPNGGGTGATNTVAVVDAAVRRGVDKVTFVRGDINNPVLTQFTRPVVVRYSDSYSTNGVLGQFKTQNVERTLVAPDILFTASDLGNLAPGLPVPVISLNEFTRVNFGPLNSAAPGVGPLGPGINEGGGLRINLSRIGLAELNSNATDNLTEEEGLTSYMWGSFDGSTNAPTVYPVGRVNLRMVESIVRNRN
jgi:hypothetical protein